MIKQVKLRTKVGQSMIRRLFILALSGIVVATALTSSVAGAASAPSISGINGLKVSPLRTNLTMSPGQNQVVPIYITDESNKPVTLQAIVNDFMAQDEIGTPSLIFNGQNASHGLKQFIGPINNVTIDAQQQVTVPVDVSIPKNTLGGGYFTAVRFAAAGNSLSSENVTLSASIASLILVQVNGPGLNQQLNIASFSVARGNGNGHFFVGSSGLNVVVRFNNGGNVQEVPSGKVVVQSLNHHVVMSEEINNPSYPSNVLPGSIRKFSVPLSGLGNIGEYKVSGYFGYGSSSQLLNTSTTIYVVSTWVMIIAIVILVAIIAGIIWLVRLFKKRLWPVKPTDKELE
jgi:hypothetical protein